MKDTNIPLGYLSRGTLVLLLLVTCSVGSNLLEVSVSDTGHYSVNVQQKQWLNSGPLSFHINGKHFSQEDGTLQFKMKTTSDGSDSLGYWTKEIFHYEAGDTYLSTVFKQYIHVPMVVFEQVFDSGAKNTSIGDSNGILSTFPNFVIDGGQEELGYLAYGGIMVADTGKKLGRFNREHFAIESGMNSGPISLFEMSGKNAIFMSPFNNFMTSSAYHNTQNGTYSWGIMGSVNDIPKGFTLSTICYYSSEGINQAIQGWGEIMRKYYNKHTYYRDSDITINYLSYWTDNGAYYVQYYEKDNLVQNMTYEESMLKVKDYADMEKLPYKSIQYSVWFQQGKGGGDATWVANPKLFPHGMMYMFEKTKLPATAHNRWWTTDTPYAKQNGGKYDWIVERDYSLPIDQNFWIDFFVSSRQMGFTTLMQDWLNTQFSAMKATTSTVDIARTWLLQMGEGARQAGLTIQYCMSMSRHVLQSLEIPVVNQARASGDYAPGKEAQFQIGISSMFAHAVGIAPFKDTFWTTENQPGNFYKNKEPFPEMQTIVATLSTGPVGPGDMVNGTNVTMLMRCCRDDGLILKPSRPAFAIDDQILQAAFGGNIGPAGELWTTYTDISGIMFGIIFGAMLKNDYKLYPQSAMFNSQKWIASKVYSRNMMPQTFIDDKPFSIGTNNCGAYCLYYTTPILYFNSTELLLLGESNKYVPMSPQRISGIYKSSNDVSIRVKVSPGEKINFNYMHGNNFKTVCCVWNGYEDMVISIVNSRCDVLYS